MGWVGQWEGGSGQGDTRTHVADSCQRMAKTTTILQSNWPTSKINKLTKKKKSPSVYLQSVAVLHWKKLSFSKETQS